MDAYIKYLGDANDNYNRFGRVIPKSETKINVKGFFNCDDAREKFIISKLMTDKKVKLNLIKTAGETIRKEVETIKEEVKEVSVNDLQEDLKKIAKRKRA